MLQKVVIDCYRVGAAGRRRDSPGRWMRMTRRGLILAAAFAAFLFGQPVRAAGTGTPAPPAGCQPVTHEGERFVACTVDLRRARVKLFWRGADGLPYGSLTRLASAQGAGLVFAMNAGMYDTGLAPVGLYVEEGRELKAANTQDGPGNFHLKPNGVFYVSGTKAGVVETGRYLRGRVKAEYATQSGPMLVINGRIHPKISTNGPSLKIRNGVGVRPDGQSAVFAISEGPVTFGAFARLFRDGLNCPNALFLDGSVSSLYAPALNRSDLGRPLGPLVGAVPR